MEFFIPGRISEAVLSNSFRSSRPEVFYKNCIPKNFTKFTGKHLCQSLEKAN